MYPLHKTDIIELLRKIFGKKVKFWMCSDLFVKEVCMRKSTCFIGLMIMVMLFGSACKHKDDPKEVIVSPIVTPTVVPTSIPVPTNGIEPIPTEGVYPTQVVEISPTPIVDITPIPSIEPEITPVVTPDIPKVTPGITEEPEPTKMPEPTVVISPTTPIPTKGAAITTAPKPTTIPESLELGDATLLEITGSNIGSSIKSQLIKNPLNLQKNQVELTQNLLKLVPGLGVYTRVDYESYEWNYYNTTDNIPVVNISSYISSEGKNARDENIYEVSYSNNSEISNEPGAIKITLRDGFQTIEEGKKILQQLLSNTIPDSYIKLLLQSDYTKLNISSGNNITNEMTKKAVYKNTPFYIDFYRKEVTPSNQAGSDIKPSIQLSATTGRSGLLYSAYRDGLVLQDEKFKEFPLDFTNFFLPLDPYHKFTGVKFTKQTSEKEKKNTIYTAEFDGYDMNGESTIILVTMDNNVGDYSISDFRYYTTLTIDTTKSNDSSTLSNDDDGERFGESTESIEDVQATENNSLSMMNNDYNDVYLKAAEYYTNYLNQIMTIATYNKDEFMNSLANDKMKLTKDITVGGYTIPCSVTISFQKDEKVANKVIANLDIEYKRQ